MKPFNIYVPEENLEFIRGKVSSFPWHEIPEDRGWDYGTNLPNRR
jgi:hypothetical protein